ncbi:MAG: sulfite exporter TauE/SafE family protein [Sediminibacterium sp.]
MINFPLLLTLYAGFTHAFETDHVLAVSNIVTKRNSTIKAIKDGLYWGLGHTSTIFIMGIIILLIKVNVEEKYFSWFEAGVGLMLVLLGIFRINRWNLEKKLKLHTHIHQHGDGQSHKHIHLHTVNKQNHQHSYFPAYNIGLVHGLAGSGNLVVLVMSKSQSVSFGLMYLLLFGLGSVLGMMLAAGIFNLPFGQKIFSNKFIQLGLVLLSASLCIIYGGWVMYKNLV